MSEEKKIVETDAEAMIRVQDNLKQAAAELQQLRDKQAGRTRMSRQSWDALTNAQRELLAPSLVKGLVVIEDVWPEEIEVTK